MNNCVKKISFKFSFPSIGIKIVFCGAKIINFSTIFRLKILNIDFGFFFSPIEALPLIF